MIFGWEKPGTVRFRAFLCWFLGGGFDDAGDNFATIGFIADFCIYSDRSVIRDSCSTAIGVGRSMTDGVSAK